MERYKNNLKTLEEVEKVKAEIEEMRVRRKKEKQQLSIMIGDIPRVQSADEMALRAIHELQQRIDNHKPSCSANIIEKIQAIENVDQEIEKQLSEKDKLKDAVSKMKDDIAALNTSTAQEISLIENSKNIFEDETKYHEKKFAKYCKKGKKTEANIEKTKLELITKEIDNVILEHATVIVEDAKKRENDFREKTFHLPYDFGNESECSDWSIVDDLS